MIEELKIVVKAPMSSTSRRNAMLDLCIESTGEEKMMLHFFLICAFFNMQGVLLAGILQGSFSPELGLIYNYEPDL